MKKSILIFCTALTIFSFMAFGFVNWNNTEIDQVEKSVNVQEKTVKEPINLVYNVDSRYLRTVTKETVDNARSVIDLYPENVTQNVKFCERVEVVILDGEYDIEKTIREFGDSEMFNYAQKKLLESTDYSTNLYISSNCKNKNSYFGELEKDSIVYWMTIVPKQEAEYVDGQDALIKYLKESSKEHTAIIKKDKLQPGKVRFTVTKKGTIDNVHLSSTSGYTSVDKVLVEIISDMSGKWKPAKNAKGEKVNQELVFFLGLQGC